MMAYKFLRDMKVFCSIPATQRPNDRISMYGHWIVSVIENMQQSFPEVLYMVVGSSVLRKACDKVLLKCHMVVGSSVSQKACDL